MEEHSNKTIMCSVLFLDIVEYSKKSVAGQISLKDRFNGYISDAIRDVPMADRIILDTGDGAAINFIGDVEDALKVALSLRESILNEDPHLDPQLLVRAGINLGPVRLVRDINGQPNIVGDGINVAQRVMGFAEAGQILVSRSYYDAVSRLSPQYAGMFHYQGSRTDKHVREHEIYAIGYPGEKATQPAPGGKAAERGGHAGMLGRAKLGWHSAMAKLGAAAAGAVEGLKQAGPGRRDLYIAAAVIMPVLVVGLLVLKLIHPGKVPALSGADQVQVASDVQPAPAAPVAPSVERKVAEAGRAQPAPVAKADTKKAVNGKPAQKKAAEGKMDSGKTGHPAKPPVEGAHKAEADGKGWFGGIAGGDAAPQAGEAHITVRCNSEAQVFVDGAQKGKVTSGMLSINVPAGKHMVIVNSVKGEIYTQKVELEPGKTASIKPRFCD